ncbi:MAG TPA: hypothetical protein PLK34_00400 [Candidatus Pacearchaeota archaeon]|nr:hypothetical protein [Candidatus Pacearchaeota archaeon]
MKPNKKKRLDKSLVLAWLAIISYVIALIFISVSITGNVVGNSSVPDNSRTISVGTFFLGLCFSFFYFRTKKR